MKISFVIPAYNEEHYIGTCLDAITKAVDGRRDCEVIVVDNNSNDHTAEIAKQYPNVIVLREPRRGANRARETGFEASHGELIACLDADTQIDADWVSRMEDVFARDPKLVCMSGPFIYYDLPKGITILVRIFYGITYLVYLFNDFVARQTSFIQGGTQMVRRSALEAIGGHNVNLSFYGDDADLAKRLNKVGKVRFSFDFAVRSSGRRLAKEGAFTMGARYGINYFWIVLFNRPFTMTSKEIRPKADDTSYHPENRKMEWFLVSLVILVTLIVISGIGYGVYRLGETTTFSHQAQNMVQGNTYGQ